jgi:hypothetical protein
MYLKKELAGEYEVVGTKPPFYELAVEKFGVNWENSICFTAHPYIYIKGGKIKDMDLLEHELVHIRQQKSYPGGSRAWWDRYFEDEVFRLEQELEAYRHQYKYVTAHYARSTHWHHLRWYAKCLMSIYAIPGMTEIKAMNLIKS